MRITSRSVATGRLRAARRGVQPAIQVPDRTRLVGLGAWMVEGCGLWGDDRGVADSFIGEVLDRQPPGVRGVLLRTVLLTG